uniref:Formin FH3 domain-containing protein n=1 Tax=Anopheles minimus TaxID=112268 RepID=A0A182VQZ8_9DIPT
MSKDQPFLLKTYPLSNIDRTDRLHQRPKMDARIGLEYIIENNDYVNKLGLALDTNNVTVKKQIFELLSTLCAFSANGYKRAIETLEHYKSIKGERYRLNLVVSELDKATAVEYQIALLAFVNCVIISAGSLKDRIRMRNEFIGIFRDSPNGISLGSLSVYRDESLPTSPLVNKTLLIGVSPPTYTPKSTEKFYI